MTGRLQSKETLIKMLGAAYDERRYLREKIVGLEAALREVDPGYRAIMDALNASADDSLRKG